MIDHSLSYQHLTSIYEHYLMNYSKQRMMMSHSYDMLSSEVCNKDLIDSIGSDEVHLILDEGL